MTLSDISHQAYHKRIFEFALRIFKKILRFRATMIFVILRFCFARRPVLRLLGDTHESRALNLTLDGIRAIRLAAVLARPFPSPT